MKLEFSGKIFERYSDLMKIRPVKAKLFHAGGGADGRTDTHDEANSRFLQFCERAIKQDNVTASFVKPKPMRFLLAEHVKR